MDLIFRTCVVISFTSVVAGWATDYVTPQRRRCLSDCSWNQVQDPVSCQCSSKQVEWVKACPQIQCPGSVGCRKYKVDPRGCPTCDCEQCGNVQCPTNCELGTVWTRSSNGCKVCRCKSIPAHCRDECPNIKCPQGRQWGPNGCPICGCKYVGTSTQQQQHQQQQQQQQQIISTKPTSKCGAVCYNACPFGRVYDDLGCPTCYCKTGITQLNSRGCPLACNKYCPNGKVVDRNGCELCDCKPVASQCPRVLCAADCPYGTQKDSNGCETCVCNNPAQPTNRCPPVCKIYCEHGNVLDNNGCEICECKPAPGIPVVTRNLPSSRCPRLSCRKWCPGGYALGSDGCPTCWCKIGPNPTTQKRVSQYCTQPACRNWCPNGYASGQNGCPTCNCKTGYGPTPTRPAQRSRCPQLDCRNQCPNGYLWGLNGCPTCDCKPSSRITLAPRPAPTVSSRRWCSRVVCSQSINCPQGFEQDWRGCPTCRCKGGQQQQRRQQRCPKRWCSKYCQNGYREDSNGCQTCWCRGD